MTADFKRTRTSTDPYLGKLKRRSAFRGALMLVVFLAVIVSGTWTGLSLLRKSRMPVVDRQEILERWEQRDYEWVMKASDDSLLYRPLDHFYLAFRGFASFHAALAETAGDRRTALVDSAIFDLRKAIAVDSSSGIDLEIRYVLGKAYYYKGSDYLDAAGICFEEVEKAGFMPPDIWEYQALVHHGLGELEASLGSFQKALEINPESPELMAAAAAVYYEAGDFSRSRSLVAQALTRTGDMFLAERCNFILADIYRKEKRHGEALELYASIRQSNPQSAEAWYQEGMVLAEQGDPIAARAAWRKAVSIDPMHPGARQQLSDRS